MKSRKQKEKDMLLDIIGEQREQNKALLVHNDRLLKENRELRNQIDKLKAEIVFKDYAMTSTDTKQLIE